MLAKGSAPFVVVPASLAALAAAGIFLAWAYWQYFALCLVIMAGLAAFSAFFFRDPERKVGDGIVSPADGRVMDVRQADGLLKIAIFMGPQDVHVNRAPMDCTVVSVERKEGPHLPAYSKESERNAAVRWTLSTSVGEVVLWQITGAFARRIVPFVGEGAKLRKGERIGMIRFGSRVDVELPAGAARPAVKVGDIVRAGATKLASGVRP
jgi:phosphatidylserine decarboxylase